MENSLHAKHACVDRVIPQLLGDPTCQGSTSQVRKQAQKEGVTCFGHTLRSRGHAEAPGGWRGCSPLLSVLAEQVAGRWPHRSEGTCQDGLACSLLATLGHMGQEQRPQEPGTHVWRDGKQGCHLSVHRLTPSLRHRVQIRAPQVRSAKSPLILLFMENLKIHFLREP